jgi:hypothetical protein
MQLSTSIAVLIQPISKVTILSSFESLGKSFVQLLQRRGHRFIVLTLGLTLSPEPSGNAEELG